MRTSRVKEAPGVVRLKQEEAARQRGELRRRIASSIIGANLPPKPSRKLRKVAVGQEALF